MPHFAFLLENKLFRIMLWVIFFALMNPFSRKKELVCYTCDNCTNPGESDGKDCRAGDFCFTAGSKRGCFSEDKVDCFRKAVGGDCYKPEEDGDKAIASKLKECLGEEPKEETCICSDDLCNGDGENIASLDVSCFTSGSKKCCYFKDKVECFKRGRGFTGDLAVFMQIQERRKQLLNE